MLCLVTQSCLTLYDPMDCSPPGSSVHEDSSGKDIGVGIQGIFPTQGSNPGLPHCRRILYQQSHQGSPRILEWAAYPFSRGSSQLRNQTRVSCIAGGFFTNRATREAHKHVYSFLNTSKENLSVKLWTILISFILFCVSRWMSACMLLKRDNDNGFLGTGNSQCFSLSIFLIFQVFYKECVNTLL